MTDGNAIVSYVPVGKSRRRWVVVVGVVLAVGASAYVGKVVWSNPWKFLPGFVAEWNWRRLGRADAERHLAEGFVALTSDPEWPLDEPFAAYDAETGVRLLPPGSGTVITAELERAYGQAYNQIVREWIRKNGIPASSMLPQFRHESDVRAALAGGTRLQPGSVMNLPGGRRLTCFLDYDGLGIFRHDALEVFHRDGKEAGRAFGVRDEVVVAWDEMTVFVRMAARTSSGAKVHRLVVIDTRLGKVIQVFSERPQ